MKTRIALALLTLSVMLVAGLIFFSPRGGHADNAGAQIRVKVVDDEGDPVRGATITSQQADGKRISRRTTDRLGEAYVDLAAADGRYRVTAILPQDYDPRHDSDGAIVGACAGVDHRLCTTLVVERGTVTMPSARPGTDASRIRFDVVDRSPEPRLHVIARDRATGAEIPGGSRTITPSSGASPVRSRSNGGNTMTGTLTAGDYTITWTPPSGWVADSVNPVTLRVDRMTTVEMWGRRPATAGGGTGAATQSTSANVYVRDADSGDIVDGGTIRWTFLDGNHFRARTRTSGELMILWPSDFIVELATPPAGYRKVGTSVVAVPPGAVQRVTFQVRRVRPVTGTGQGPGTSTSAPTNHPSETTTTTPSTPTTRPSETPSTSPSTTIPATIEPVPSEPIAVEPLPPAPVPYEPIVVEPLPSEPAPSEPIAVEPLPPAPVPYEPIVVEPLPSEPAPSEPIVVEPVPSEPVPSAPIVVEPVPSDPIVVEPVPSEPVPSDPIVVEPVPSEPGGEPDVIVVDVPPMPGTGQIEIIVVPGG